MKKYHDFILVKKNVRSLKICVAFSEFLNINSENIYPHCAAETLEQLLVRLFHITTLITDHQVED